MNILAFDIGDSRVGIAYGNINSKLSTPLCVLSPDEILNKSKQFQNILLDYMPQKFIFGLPKSLNGELNKQAEHVKEIAKQISSLYDIEYDFVDERLSSKEARQILREQGLSEKQMKGKIDSVAASLFLDTYLKSI